MEDNNNKNPNEMDDTDTLIAKYNNEINEIITNDKKTFDDEKKIFFYYLIITIITFY